MMTAWTWYSQMYGRSLPSCFWTVPHSSFCLASSPVARASVSAFWIASSLLRAKFSEIWPSGLTVSEDHQTLSLITHLTLPTIYSV